MIRRGMYVGPRLFGPGDLLLPRKVLFHARTPGPDGRCTHPGCSVAAAEKKNDDNTGDGND